MGKFKPDLKKEYIPMQVYVDLWKVLGLALLAKGKQNEKPKLEPLVKKWFGHNELMITRAIIDTQKNKGDFSNAIGFEVFFSTLCQLNGLSEYLDEKDSKVNQIKSELFLKCSDLFGKPRLNGLSKQSVEFLKKLKF